MEAITALAADPICRTHLQGRRHPECPERFDAVMGALALTGVKDRCLMLEPRAATQDELALCHTREYLAIARHDVESGQRHLSTGDTEIGPDSYQVALHAVGAALNAVDAVFAKRARNAFSAMRPPGHHANSGRGMGFCLFNNVAIAARYAQQRYGIDRALIVDWDVHHGNGTQDIFYADPSVFFFSTHQWPLYPGTGRADETGTGAGEGTTLNFPFPAGSGRNQILGAVLTALVPAMRKFRPELVLVSAGFDSRIDDLLGQFTLTDSDFADLTDAVMEIADEHAGSRLVSLLEGGYNLSGLASAAASHVGMLQAS